MKGVTARAYSFDESQEMAQANGFSINPTLEMYSEDSREQSYKTGNNSVTITTGQIDIVNEQYGIFGTDKNRKVNTKSNELYSPQYSLLNLVDGMVTGGKTTDVIERNHYTYSESTSTHKAKSIVGTIYSTMETVLTGKHDYRNVNVYKNWNDYSKSNKSNSRMLKYKR